MQYFFNRAVAAEDSRRNQLLARASDVGTTTDAAPPMPTPNSFDKAPPPPPLFDVSLASNSLDVKRSLSNYEDTRRRLNFYYAMVKRQLMRHQDEASGLFITDWLADSGRAAGHLRDNIYAAAALWALSRAYKKIDNDEGRTYELSQCAVKCMRRILLLWMSESDRIERFKNNQSPANTLHCKYYIDTLDPVDDYPHLQIDVVALYLINMCQMIESGLYIIYTLDEVSVVQNLVFYLERAYRTPDFGIWECGSRNRNGQMELHASSIGAAKVALECLNGFNLFGDRGSSWSVIYVDVDAHNRNRTVSYAQIYCVNDT